MTGVADRPGAPAATWRPGDLRVEVHPEGAAVRVVPVGELDLATVGQLEAELDGLRAAGLGEVVLDLRELAFIDSTGVRLILAEERGAREDGREFGLIGGPPAVQRILEISGVVEHLRFRAP